MQYILRNPVQNKSQFLCIILGHLKAFVKTILRELFSKEEAWERKDLVVELCYPLTSLFVLMETEYITSWLLLLFPGRH